MLVHYVRTALRTLRRRPGYTVMNVGGLAVALAAALLLARYVRLLPYLIDGLCDAGRRREALVHLTPLRVRRLSNRRTSLEHPERERERTSSLTHHH